jgi:tripartite-type tricarboxylate transporter receptor subunit TctC
VIPHATPLLVGAGAGTVRGSLARFLAPLGILLAISGPASAQTSPSLAGRTVNVIIGFGSGGGYDVLGRAVARHLGRHLPGNPNVVAQNMPGGGSYTAANHIYSVAPKDGTALALIAGEAALGPMTGASGARFDPTRLTWIGTPRTDTNILLVFNRPEMKVRTLKDAYQHELVLGSAGAGIGAYTYTKALSGLFGLKFKAILGFRSSSEMALAVERGEVDGYFASLDSIVTLRPEWIGENKVTMLLYGGAMPNPPLKGVPHVLELARNAEDKAAIEFLYAGLDLSRPFIAPPDMPPDRAKMLQDAFMATMRDPEFLADAEKQKLGVDPRDSAYLTGLIQRIYATPKPLVEKVTALMK